MTNRLQLLLNFRPGRLLQYAWFRIKLFAVRRLLFLFPSKTPQPVGFPSWTEWYEPPFLAQGHSFTLLNISRNFDGPVDWGFSGNGKLWMFRLQAFDYLLRKDISATDGLAFMKSYADYLQKHPASFDPYPASLRIINWIKFLAANQLHDEAIVQSLFSQCSRLYHCVEWHLRNNHVLEYGFALLFAGLYFNNKKFLRRAEEIIARELPAQVLDDGAHFERCPMYHQQMLHRVLDAIRLIRAEKESVHLDLQALESLAGKMTGWMNSIKFENGKIPQLNDSAEGAAIDCDQLNHYAKRLDIVPMAVALSGSGFRKFKGAFFECLVDAGGLDPRVNAGHAHADSLHFVLNSAGKPFIIDSGISTYQPSGRRLHERSTVAHNTVAAFGKNQSEQWSVFRYGRAAQTKILKETRTSLEASVLYFDGSTEHSRLFEFSDDQMKISDKISGKESELSQALFFVEKLSQLGIGKSTIDSKFGSIAFEGAEQISIDEAEAATEFNRTYPCQRIKILFRHNLITTFTFHAI